MGCDYTQSGRLACGVSALLTNECGHVCILSFDSGNIPSSVDRIDGFQREIADRYPDIQILDTRFLSTDVEPDHFLTRAKEMFARYEEAEVLYLVNPATTASAGRFPESEPNTRSRSSPTTWLPKTSRRWLKMARSL